MKKLALLACGLLCVLFIATAAFAKPPKVRHRGFEQVGRNGVSHNYSRTMRNKAHSSSFIRRIQRSNPRISAPRDRGELWGASNHRRASARSYADRTRTRAATGSAAHARVKPAIRCADGVACGNASRSKHDPSSRAKSRRSFLQYSASQERRWKKIFKLHSEKWEPPKSKALKSGCMDFAQCL